MDERLLLTPTEAAARLGIGRTTVYQLIAERKIPTVRVGSRVRIPATALNHWIAAQAESSTTGEQRE